MCPDCSCWPLLISSLVGNCFEGLFQPYKMRKACCYFFFFAGRPPPQLSKIMLPLKSSSGIGHGLTVLLNPTISFTICLGRTIPTLLAYTPSCKVPHAPKMPSSSGNLRRTTSERIIESLRLEKTSKIIKSNPQRTSTHLVITNLTNAWEKGGVTQLRFHFPLHSSVRQLTQHMQGRKAGTKHL